MVGLRLRNLVALGATLVLAGCGGGGDRHISPASGIPDYVVLGDEVYTLDGPTGGIVPLVPASRQD